MRCRLVLVTLLLISVFAGVAAADLEEEAIPEYADPLVVPPLEDIETAEIDEAVDEDPLVDVAAARVAPVIEWGRALGGSLSDTAFSISQTTDRGYFIIGYTASYDGQVNGHHDSSGWYLDIWTVRLSPAGALIWQRCLGGYDDQCGYDGHQTSDGGYIIVGSTKGSGGDVSGCIGSADVWVVKLDAAGSLAWQRCIGGSFDDEGYSIEQTTDGGYILAGYTKSNDGNVTGNHGGKDGLIVKLDESGDIEWLRHLGGSGWDEFSKVRQTPDGGYIVAGYTASNSTGDIGLTHGGDEIWLVKLTGTGFIDWQRLLGGTGSDMGTDIHPTEDGGYILVGTTTSTDGDISGHNGNYDVWAAKLDVIGRVVWQRCCGGSWTDTGRSVVPVPGGYVVAGSAFSTDGDVSGHKGYGYNIWMLGLDDGGHLLWQKCIGGSDNSGSSSIIATGDGGFALAGYTQSPDGDIPGHHGYSDYAVVKCSADTAPAPTAGSITLHPGWNFISTPKRLAEGNHTAAAVFGAVNTSGHSVFSYDAVTGNWSAMGPSSSVSPLEGIWIYANATTTIPLTFASGGLQTPPTRQLVAGWNAIGFGGTAPVSARDCLLSVNDCWATLLRWDGFGQEYGGAIINGGSGDAADSALLYPTEGYWIFMREGGVLGAVGA